MTAEIAILNKNGIALAADSAVTISTSGSDEAKIYNSANKLFALSMYAPVGIMVFDSAEIMGVPWETVIKLYRKRLGKKRFRYLSEYHKNFVSFLEKGWNSEAGQKEYVVQMATAAYVDMVETIDEAAKQIIVSAGSITAKQVHELCSKTITENHNDWKKQLKLNHGTTSTIAAVTKKYKLDYQKLISHIFESRPLDASDHRKLFDIASIFSVVIPGMNTSGVVIAGYGEDEYFPSVHACTIGKILLGKATVMLGPHKAVTHNNKAGIVPFAQSAEVFTFMEGVGSQIQKYFDESLGKILKESFPESLAEDLKNKLGLTNEVKKDVIKIISNMGEGVHDFVLKNLANLRRTKYSRPVINAVSFLSVPDLAVMAETFVNLESFRKKVTFTTETVGGPIDVLVITKGDGLIWIRRKHYFDQNLNHHFFSNYYQECEINAKEKN